MDQQSNRPAAQVAAFAFEHLGGPDAPLILRHAAMLGPTVHHRLSFPSGPSADTALHPDVIRPLWPLLGEALARAPTRTEAPGFILTRPGLVLADLALTTSQPGPDRRLARLRFRFAIGRFEAAFATPPGLDHPTLAHREALALGALDDLARPLLDLAETLSAWPKPGLPDAAQASLPAALAAIETHRHDLTFYADLLRRYLRSCDPTLTR